jgi:excisionase family DNA binding protein
MTNDHLPVWLTRREAADYLRINEKTIDEYRKSGRLPFFRVGAGVRFERSAVTALVSQPRRA